MVQGWHKGKPFDFKWLSGAVGLNSDCSSSPRPANGAESVVCRPTGLDQGWTGTVCGPACPGENPFEIRGLSGVRVLSSHCPSLPRRAEHVESTVSRTRSLDREWTRTTTHRPAIQATSQPINVRIDIDAPPTPDSGLRSPSYSG